MLKISLQDLIIRLDEQKQVFQMLVPKRGARDGELQVFYEISEQDALGDESVEDAIGKSILAFLSAKTTSNLFGLQRYRDAGSDFAQSMEDESTVLSQSGNADSEFEGAKLRIDRFNETWTLEDVDGLTALMKSAAQGGSKKAKDFLRNVWPAHSAILKKRILRGKDV